MGLSPVDTLGRKLFGGACSISTAANTIEAGGDMSVPRPFPGC